MPSPRRFGSPASRPWIWPILVALLALASSLSGVGNQFVQDDIPIIWKNPRVHDLSAIGRVFTESYWPPPFIAALYRPFASVSFGLQWAIGEGSPLVFRLVSYLLYALTAVAVFRLARLRLSPLVAVAAAALFAAHPVHVESVAVAVNQSELWVGLILSLAVALYIRQRSAGGPLPARTQLVLAALYLIACLFKENALVLPGLLVAAEVLLVPAGEPVRSRLAMARQPLLLLLLVAVAFYAVRTTVLSGDLAGTFAAEGFTGLTMGDRALTMLAVVLDWTRLLFWPAHLRADYSPGEIVGATHWGAAQTAGLALLVFFLVVALMSWRRAPLVTFGLAWCAIALFPVHNVLVPTGIVLAERTLFLPSIGAMLVLGGAGEMLLARASRRAQGALAVVTAVLVMGGVFRSATRHPVWHDQFKLWYQTANEDAPRSFRAHEAMAETYFSVRMERMAEQEFHLAIQFAPPGLTRPSLAYAERLRQRSHCYPAVPLYRKVLEVHANHSPARAALIACLLHLGEYREAAFNARMGSSFGWQVKAFQQALITADSARLMGVPTGSVRFSLPSADTLSSYMRVGEKP